MTERSPITTFGFTIVNAPIVTPAPMCASFEIKAVGWISPRTRLCTAPV